MSLVTRINELQSFLAESTQVGSSRRWNMRVTGKLLPLPPGYYVEGIEVHSWQTGASIVTKITVQN